MRLLRNCGYGVDISLGIHNNGVPQSLLDVTLIGKSLATGFFPGPSFGYGSHGYFLTCGRKDHCSLCA